MAVWICIRSRWRCSGRASLRSFRICEGTARTALMTHAEKLWNGRRLSRRYSPGRSPVRPMQVFVGGSDELLDAEKLKAEFRSQRSDVPVSIIPGLGHSDMVTKPDSIRALVAAFD